MDKQELLKRIENYVNEHSELWLEIPPRGAISKAAEELNIGGIYIISYLRFGHLNYLF